tara:strand:+ start:1007 stop:1201 length:195 start_codon:yes stop_codon:yes gene_type:complete
MKPLDVRHEIRPRVLSAKEFFSASSELEEGKSYSYDGDNWEWDEEDLLSVANENEDPDFSWDDI